MGGVQRDCMEIGVRRPGGWTTVTFPDDVEIHVVGGKVDGNLALTLIGTRDEGHHVVEPRILDVGTDDEHLLANEVPRTEDGESVVLDQLVNG